MQHQQPDLKQLRQFGLIMGSGLVLVFYLVLPLVFGVGYMVWPMVVALIFAAMAFAAPACLGFIYKPWMMFAHFLGKVNTTIILSLIYFFLITPLGILFRLTGAVNDSAPDNDQTFRKISNKRERDHLERPY